MITELSNLRTNNLIKNRQTNCWSCKTPISESGDGICPECDYAIKCSCGKCACDKPGSKIKKKGPYEAE